jgi:hypothetical protein
MVVIRFPKLSIVAFCYPATLPPSDILWDVPQQIHVIRPRKYTDIEHVSTVVQCTFTTSLLPDQRVKYPSPFEQRHASFTNVNTYCFLTK